MNTGKQHRVIGIRHVLRKMKDAGLVEEESLYANEAVADVQEELKNKASTWYRVGAKRGAVEALDAILDGRISINKAEDGSIELIANVTEIEWEKSLNVSVGSQKSKIRSKKYKIPVNDLGFN